MYSMEKDVVLDPFMGQATTSVCAFKKNRNFLTYELNPETYSIGVKSLRQLGAFDEMP